MVKFYAICSSLLFLFVASASAANPTLRDVYAEGRKAMQEGQWTKSLECFNSLEKDYTLLGDYVLFDMATCYEKSGENDKAIASLRRIISGYKNFPLYRKAFRRIIEMEKDGDTNAVLKNYELYLLEFPQDSKALWEKAALLEKTGLQEEAFPLWKEIFLSGSSYALAAYEALKAKSYKFSRAEISLAASRLSEKENYLQTVRLLEEITPLEEEGKYLLARAYFRLRRYRDATRILSGISFRDSKYLLALSLIRMNEKADFYRLIEAPVKQGQNNLFSLYSMAAELKRREGKIAESGAIMQSMMSLYPEKGEEITWSRAWMAIREGQLGAAERLLSGLVKLPSKEQDKYLFWLGKVKIYQGQSGDVFFSQIKDQTGYYWFKAGKKGKRLPENGRGDAKKENLLPLPEEANRNMLRITELESLKMRAEARQEARAVIGTVAEPYFPSFARLMVAIGDYYSLVKIGIRFNSLELKYPLAFRDTVFKHAEACRIDPMLVTAIMREESHFNNDAVSSAGALGVMQLMPATAKRVANVKNREELFDAGINIKVGIDYLSQLLGRFKTLSYAVAAYNAGEHNVEKWLTSGYRDEDEFTEDIPFSETKSYVFRVMKTYGILKSFYGEGG